MSSSFRPWAFWRRLYYGSGFFLVSALFCVGIYFVFFAQPATCFDGVMNGSETGIDCGGGCVRVCAADVAAPRVVWAKSF